VAVLEILLGIAAVMAAVPASVLFVQVLMAIIPVDSHSPVPAARPRLAVMIPAHNEAAVIADTLRAIVAQLVAGDRLLVVADNCSDDTAKIAVEAGAEVLERADRERRGKGYALDFGVRHLERNPPEVVLIVDADCQVGVGTIDRLARVCGQTVRPVQALYLMHSPEGAGMKTRIAEFAWRVKNQVRPLGYHRLGLPCQLMGTGMAFPWSGISTTTLASGHIVEDLLLGINLTRAGTPPLFCPQALVTSFFPSSREGIQEQRTRWEHGHLGMILGVAPRLFAEAIARGNVKLMALALDLCVPPLALLMVLVLAVFAANAVFFAVTSLALPLWLATASLVMLGLSVLCSWGWYGRRVISLSSLACAPFYVLWKIPLYLKFLVRRQVEWVRSKRDMD
jgi:cellulose synthase/poly-beta-1,6-N-acetylglucosamine synthase-like glycosyltransferase